MGLRSALFVMILQLGGAIANCQLKITSLNLKEDQVNSYSFPVFHSYNARAAQKINAYLQKEVLYNDTILTDTQLVFRKSRYINSDDSSWQPGYSALDYRTELNNQSVLSLSFELETTGAYTYYNTLYYNFEVETGLHLRVGDLFTPAGIVEIKKLLRRERQKRIQAWMKEMDTTYNIEDNREHLQERFAECNADADEDNFLLKEKSIVFAKGHCFSHLGMAYETDLDVEMTLANIQKWLSSNGKKLLLQKH